MTPHKKRSELDVIFDLILNGFNKKQIRKKLDLKPSALSNSLGRLEDMGYIKREGKYNIKVLQSSHLHPRVTKNQVHISLNKRGHAFNFRILFPREENLKKNPKVKALLSKNKLEMLSFGSYKFEKDHTTIWINTHSITAYSRNSYYAKNTLHSKFRALQDVDHLARYIKDKFGYKGYYGIEVFREHYGLIFNKFAQWLLKKGKKMYITNKENKAILWVDDSRKDDIRLEEFEGKDPLDVNKADRYFESHEKTNWDVTPEYVLNGFNELQKDRQETRKELKSFAIALNRHIPAYEGMAQEAKGIKEALNVLNKKIDKLKGGENDRR